MSKDLNKLIDQVAHNRRMPKEKVIEMFKEIVLSRATRDLELYYPLKVEFNEQEGEVEIYSFKQVVGIVEDKNSQIEFQQAMKIKPDAQLGDGLYVRVQPDLVKSLLPDVLRELWTGVSDEGRENKTEMGNGERMGDYRVAERHRTRDLPRIPDLPERGKPVSISLQRSEEPTDVMESEGDASDLISILVNNRSITEKTEPENKPFDISNNEPEFNIENILSEIERVLRENGYLQLRRNLNELEVDVTKCNSSFTTIFHIYHEIVSARTLLPFVKGVSVDLLTLCGQADFMSSVGLVLQKNKPCYIIKNVYPVKALSRRTLWEMISQPILDASKANEIINSKKPLGK